MALTVQSRVSSRIAIAEPTHVSEARRAAALIAERCGLDATRAGGLGLVVTEAATNLLKHAGGGELLLRELREPEPTGVEMLTLDRGPGMGSTERSRRDGHSTSGTSGNGLGAIERQSTLFDLYSRVGHGTVLMARVGDEPRPAEGGFRPMELGAVCVAVHGETQCGDLWAYRALESREMLLVVDGLGHGEGAAEAAREAVLAFERARSTAPNEMVEALHEALRPTRGAALAVASIDTLSGVVEYCGVGNIGASIEGPDGGHHLVSNGGIVGHSIGQRRTYTYAFPPEALIVLHSDGIASRWTFDTLPAILSHHPAVIAGALFRDHARGRDDATVLVARRSRP